MAFKAATRIQKIRYYAIARWAIYILILFVCAVLINIGKGVRPIYFIPMCICICMHEGEYTAAILGGICGLIIDESYGRMFFGFSSIIMIAICVGSTVVFRHFLFKNGINAVMMSTASVFIYQIIEYFFYYAMWGYEGTGYVFSNICIPCILYTVAVSPIAYIIIKPIIKRFYPKKAKTIEEAMKI